MKKTYKQSSLSKITPPTVTHLIPRLRLFDDLYRSMQRPAVWVSSPAGSGKTSLVSSYIQSRQLKCLWYQIDEGDSDLATFFYYMGIAVKNVNPYIKEPMTLLTPEYLGGLGTFAKRYFEEIYSRLTTSGYSVIVLDNLQEVGDSCPLFGVLISAIEGLPEDIRIIMISRKGLPSSFVRLKSMARIGFIGWEELQFTKTEISMLFDSRQMKLSKDQTLDQIHEITQGWAAGITLILENNRVKNRLFEFDKALDFQDIFDYFLNEIFYKLEPEVKDFLLKTCHLPVVDALNIEEITTYTIAQRILGDLERNNFFIKRLSGKGEFYQYHALFREFLMKQARDLLDPASLRQLQNRSAFTLMESGNIEEAASLYSISGNWQGLTDMVINNANELIQQCRNKTLLSWIESIEALTAIQNPWLLYWKGLCNLPFDMQSARIYLNKAYKIFNKTDDIEGLFLCWSAIVDSYVLELDDWRGLDECIDTSFEITKRHPLFPSRMTELITSSRMLIALTLRKTDNPQLVDRWFHNVSNLLQENPSISIRMDIVFYMSVYYLWRGEYNKNSALLEKADDEISYQAVSPFSAIRIKLIRGIHCWVTAQFEDALSILSDGLLLSKREGISIFDLLLWNFRAETALAMDKIDIAKDSLLQMKLLLNKAKTLDVYFYNILSSWHALFVGNVPLALEHLESIRLMTERIGFPYYIGLWHIGMAYSTFLQNKTESAIRHIDTAYEISLGMKSSVLQWFSHITRAYFSLKQGSTKEGIKQLKKALILGKQYGYALLEFYLPSVMQYLYAVALSEGLETVYVKGLINKLMLSPPDSLNHTIETDNWPYPVRINTLGKFEIIINDRTIEFTGKTPEKPITLLKAIIAKGGVNVSVHKLTDTLWPESRGDLAHKSFETTLMRLRRIFGDINFITCSSNKVRIDSNYCLIDIARLNQLFDRLFDCSPEEIEGIWKMIKPIYKGHFLQDDIEDEWAFSMRESCIQKMIRAVQKTGIYYEGKGRWDEALLCYQKGLEVDSLIEGLYQRMMICYSSLGSNTEGINTYHKCRETLFNKFGIKPSRQTEAIYRGIISQ